MQNCPYSRLCDWPALAAASAQQRIVPQRDEIWTIGEYGAWDGEKDPVWSSQETGKRPQSHWESN